jgi:hypothetical protein
MPMPASGRCTRRCGGKVRSTECSTAWGASGLPVCGQCFRGPQNVFGTHSTVTPWLHSAAAPCGSAAEDRLFKNLQPPRCMDLLVARPYSARTPPCHQVSSLPWVFEVRDGRHRQSGVLPCLRTLLPRTVRVLSGASVRPSHAIAIAPPPFLPPRSASQERALATRMRAAGPSSRIRSTIRPTCGQLGHVGHMSGVC